MARRTQATAPDLLRERVLGHFSSLRIPIEASHLDAVLRRSEEEGLPHLVFLDRLIGEQASLRRERSIERRIRHARFAERKTLEEFDWNFNRAAIDRVRFEELGTAAFVARKDNLLIVGKSGVGKSHLVQALGMRACVAGFSVRYVASAALITELTAALADKSLPQMLGRYTRPDLVIIDEFGFDKVERAESPEAASLLYKVVHARHNKGSTAICTNIDLKHWGDYLGDPALSMALLDRLVENAVLIRIKNGKSYRAEMARRRDQGQADAAVS